MSELWKTLSSPTWWVSTIVVSFAVSLVANWAAPALSRKWSTFSLRRRQALTAADARRRAVVLATANDIKAEVYLHFESLRSFIFSMFLMTVAVGLTTIGIVAGPPNELRIAVKVITLATVAFSASGLIRSVRFRLLLTEVYALRRASRKESAQPELSFPW